MEIAKIDFFIIFIYFIAVLFIGFISSRKQTKEGFFIANRALNFGNLIATISASLLGGGVLITFVAYVYQYGLSGIWFIAGISIGVLMFLLFYKKLKALSDKNNFYTLSDYFYHKYGNKLGLLSAVVIFIWAFCLILMQFIAGGKVLSAILGTPYASSVLIMGTVVFIYLVLGGFNAVVKTDYFQYGTIVLLAIVILFPLSQKTSLISGDLQLGEMGVIQSLAFLFIGAFNVVVSADIWQRVYASKNSKHAKIGIIGSSLLIFFVGLILSIIGLAAKSNYPEIEPDQALVYGISNLLPTGLLGMGLVMLFSVIMSTLDTMLFIVAMNISNDILVRFNSTSKEVSVKSTRFLILLLAVIGMLIAIFVQDIISVGFSLTGIGLSLAPVVIASFFKELKIKAAFLSVLSGLASICIVLAAGIIGPETSVISLPVSAVFLCIGQFTFKN
ncbi:MAG TPA: sodium:solute symporter family protein [Candidatus Scalindua sp.]|nr:sodium:solute symporter family protein [Candidatus Scalindua sp.]